MKVYVITHSSTYEARAEAVGAWFAARGASVTWIFSDFDHHQMKNVFRKREDHVYLHMAPYRANLSPGRLRSIRAFAGSVKAYLEGKEADLLWFLIPANSFVPAAKRLKEKTGAKVVFDIIDLWPESLPVSRGKELPPLRAWKAVRDRDLDCADQIFTECGLYRELVRLPEERTETLYWFKERGAARREHVPDPGTLRIAYIGSINHLIDGRTAAELVRCLKEERKVAVQVIGNGEGKEGFLRELREAGAEVTDHGTVYDEEEKAAIFSACDFGLNMMVPQVRVGLTMKSLDYLAYGLPLLNSIPGDTWELTEACGAGINVPREDPAKAVPAILEMADAGEAGDAAERLYSELFTKEAFDAVLDRTAGRLLAEERPAVSVALAACNGERYLREQLDSILAQLAEGDEVIVSVDPSEDATLELVCEYAAADERVRVLEGPGKGVIRNVENALRHCSGRAVFLADQDDVWLPEKAEKVCRSLETSTLVLHDAVITDAELRTQEPSYMEWRGSRQGIAANLWKNSYIGCCMAFRRELLEHILPFPEDLPMHDQWIGLMAEKHGTVHLLRTPLIRYRRHGNNATKRTHADLLQMLKWRTAITKEVLKR